MDMTVLNFTAIMPFSQMILTLPKCVTTGNRNNKQSIMKYLTELLLVTSLQNGVTKNSRTMGRWGLLRAAAVARARAYAR